MENSNLKIKGKMLKARFIKKARNVPLNEPMHETMNVIFPSKVSLGIGFTFRLL